MLEKPDVPDDLIIAALNDAYPLRVAAIDFLPIGNDATAWVYRVRGTNGTPYFLKLKRGAIVEPSLAVPRFLNDSGIQQVVAPLPTATRTLWTPLGSYHVILYPFIDGRIGANGGLSDPQWTEFGAVLKTIHSTQIPMGLASSVARERFIPAWLRLTKELHAETSEREFPDPLQRELAAFWRDRSGEIDNLMTRAAALGRLLQKRTATFVLCHADIHLWNVMIDTANRLHIVDWDGVILAPKERDLMFVDRESAARFFEGYGATDLDPLALAYYRYEWVIQEMGDFGARVFRAVDLGDAIRQEAVQGFMQLFQPGDVVEAAYESEARLPPDSH